MDKNIIIAIVLGILVLVSIVQAFQLNTLRGKISEGALTLGKAKSSVSTATSGGGHSSGGNLPANIQDLPSMVGGC